MKAPTLVTEPLRVVTVTSTMPAGCGGVITVMSPSFVICGVTAAPPNETEVAPSSHLPEMKAAVPPLVGALAGAIVVTCGAGAGG